MTRALVAILAVMVLVVGGYWYGAAQGSNAERTKHDAQTLTDLTNLVESHKTLVFQANTASQALQLAITARTEADARSTKELKNALRSTAGSRVGCVFDDGVLRQLEQARSRAAQAAASGIRTTLPEPAREPSNP